MAVSALVIRSMSMAFRVMLSERLSAQGMGLYQLVLSVYLVFAAAASTGVSLCATRIFSELTAAGSPGKARFSVEKCMMFSFMLGTVLGGIMFSLAHPLSELALRDSRAALPITALSASLPFLAVSACVRGYFLARRKTLQTCGEQLLEQLIEIGSFILMFQLFRPENLEQACLLTVAGTTAAEIISFVYSIVCYRTDVSAAGIRPEPVSGLVSRMLPVFLPVTANACLRFGLSAAENTLIPAGLQQNGLSYADSLSQYGIICGMTLPALTFPSVLVLPFASLIISEIADERIRCHTRSVRHITEKMVSAALRYSIPVTVLFIFYGIPLCRLLFKNDDAGRFLVMLAPVIPFMYLDSVVDSILKGLNEQTSYFIFNTIDSLIRVLLTIVLLPFMGISGVVTVIIISELLNTLMSLLRLVRITSFRLRIIKDVLLPTGLILLPCLLLSQLPSPDSALSLAVSAVLCTAVYILLLKFCGRRDAGRQGILFTLTAVFIN